MNNISYSYQCLFKIVLHSDNATLDVKVRSPYSRVLSAYTDKVVFQHHKLKHNSSKKLLPRGYEMDSGFGPLIDIIAKLPEWNWLGKQGAQFTFQSPEPALLATGWRQL